MNERTPIFVAACVGALVIGGLLIASHRADSLAPRVLGQRIVPGGGGMLDAVRIDVEPSAALLRLAATGDTWNYRVVGSDGRLYAQVMNGDEHTRSIVVPRVYSRPPRDPQIQTWFEDECRATVALGELPPPIADRLPAQDGGPIRAFHLSPSERRNFEQDEPEGRGIVRFTPRAPLLPGEYWGIDVVRTPVQRRLTAFTPYYPKTPEKAVVRLYGADDFEAVRVQVRRYVHCSRSERIVLSNLRLVDRGGQTALDWGGSRLPNSLGLDLRRDFKGGGLPYLGSKPPAGDLRMPSLSFVLPPAHPAFQESDPALRSLDFGEEETEQVTMKFDAPDFERLHIAGLTLGGAYWRSWLSPLNPPGNTLPKFAGAVDHRPFGTTIILTKEWNEPRGSFEATIPVEPAP